MSIQRMVYEIGVQEQIPELPFVIIRSDGVVGEADSIRGVISIIIPEYMDAEDSVDDWNLRVKYARKQAMFALRENKNIVVYDKEKGIINNNYAAAEDDDDYFIDEEVNEKIYVNSEKDFLRSLARLGIIKFLQWDDIDFSDLVNCDKCAHYKDGICNVYNTNIDKITICESGIERIEGRPGESYKFIG